MSELRKAAAQFAVTISEVCMQAQQDLLALEEAGLDRAITPEVRTDLGFLLRETSEKLDELRKDIDAKREKIGTVLAIQLMRRCMEGEDSAEGVISKSTFSSKARVVMPKRGSIEYGEMLESMGVPEEAASISSLTPHYPTLRDYLHDLLEEGKQVPFAHVKAEIKPNVSYRKKRGKSALDLLD